MSPLPCWLNIRYAEKSTQVIARYIERPRFIHKYLVSHGTQHTLTCDATGDNVHSLEQEQVGNRVAE